MSVGLYVNQSDPFQSVDFLFMPIYTFSPPPKKSPLDTRVFTNGFNKLVHFVVNFKPVWDRSELVFDFRTFSFSWGGGMSLANLHNPPFPLRATRLQIAEIWAVCSLNSMFGAITKSETNRLSRMLLGRSCSSLKMILYTRDRSVFGRMI